MDLKRRIDIEILLVLGVSLGRSAVYSVVAFIAALTAPKGLGGSTTTINESESPREWLDATYQLLGTFFQIVPVFLALFLLGSGAMVKVGLSRLKLGSQLLQGLAIAAAIGIPGLGLYLAARAMKLSVQVVATDVLAYWWTTPMLLLSAAGAALIEEAVMIGYLFARLKERGLSDRKILWISALVRGSYHLYQGVGGFVGNIVMGLVFGKIFQKTGRLLPLLFAHFLLDAVVFVGYAWAKTFLPFL